MNLRFGLNSVVLLVVALITACVWIGAEYYHRQNNVDISPELTRQSETPINSSFDKETLRRLYLGKDKFYEQTQNSSN